MSLICEMCQHLLVGRGMYREYSLNAVAKGQHVFGKEKFRESIDKVLEAVLEQLNLEVEHLHNYLKKEKKWKRGCCGADGSWSKPKPAPHGVFCVRSMEKDVKGGLLGFQLFSTKVCLHICMCKCI